MTTNAALPVRQTAAPPQMFLVGLHELGLDNVREDEGSPEELAPLGDSLAVHQDYPILLRKHVDLVHPHLKWRVADGHRRVRAARQKGMTHLLAQEVEGEALEIALRTAAHRKGLTDYEQFKAVKAFGALHPDWTRKQLAERLAFDPPVVTKLLTEGVPGVEQAFKENRIRLGVRYEIARMPPEEQAGILAARLNGLATRDDLVGARKRRKAGVPTVRVNRVKVALKSGVCAALSGEAMALEDVVSALAEMLKEAKRAHETGLDVKTWAMVMADLHKAKEVTP